MDNLKEQIENQIKTLVEQGLEPNNVEYIYKLIDIHKDIENEKYWKVKEENIMRYRDYGNYDNYGNYGRRQRDSRGRFKDSGYGRRWDGEEMLDGMYDGYHDYAEGREEYGRGNYGAKENTMKSLEYMLQSVTNFIEMLKKDAGSQEEVEMIKEYTRHISEM